MRWRNIPRKKNKGRLTGTAARHRYRVSNYLYSNPDDGKLAVRTPIILRANTIGEEIFGEGATIYLMSTRPKTQFSISIYFFRTLLNLYRFRSITRKAFKLKHAFTSKDLLEDEECLVQNFTKARELSWEINAFDVTFQKIADEEDYGVIFVASDFKSILAPYDGGFDLILPDTGHVKRLKETYKDWLSDNPAGL